jgi:hypothetical protein
MSEAKFTPGEWFVDAEQPSGALRRIRAKADGEPIADVFALDRGHIDHDQEEAGASARLIAAAPDLYRELVHLVRLLDPMEATLDVPGMATLNGARAVIGRVG